MKKEYALRKKLRCPNCRKKMKISSQFFLCDNCGKRVFLPKSNKRIYSNTSLGEKVFDFPILYNLKVNVLNRINQLKIPINPIIKNEEVLDVGCGSYQSRYLPNEARLLVGIDPSIKALQIAQKLYPDSFYFIASADKLPFAKKSFDIVLILFTLHHLNLQSWGEAIKEANRVARKGIIIYDHVKSEFPLISFLQMAYWKIFDGGHTYPREKEWKKALKLFKIKKYYRLGSLFKHICFFYLQPTH